MIGDYSSVSERDTQILSLGPLVGYLARRLREHLPLCVDVRDLEGAAWLGAIHAVDHYDGSRRVTLECFARLRIQGAMLDYLRDMDHLSRDHRAAIRRGELDGEPVPYVVPLHDLRGDTEYGALVYVPDESAARCFRAVNARMEVERRFELAKLKPRSRSIVERVNAGETMKDVGHAFGINESRVSQIRSRALRQLREAA